MTDRELEARLQALYRSRVPAEDGAPIELRSELVAIARGSSPTVRIGGSRAWTLLAAAALLGAMLIGGALLAGSGLLRSVAIVPPTDSSPMATPSPSHDPWWHIPRGWPSMRAGPAGLYTWDPFGRSWMHKVPARLGRPDGVKDSVELMFRLTAKPNELEAMAAALASYGDGPYPEQPIEIPSLAVETWVDESGASAVNGVTVQPGAPGASLWKLTQTWLLQYNGRVIAFDITSYPDTSPELIAEAEAAILSVRPELPDAAATPVPSGYPYPMPRFVFELTQGWDSG